MDKTFTIWLLIGLALICAIWAPVMQLANLPKVSFSIYMVLCFCLSALLLGGVLIGLLSRNWERAEFAEFQLLGLLGNIMLWVIGTGICWSTSLASKPIIDHYSAWPFAVSTAGMIAGALIWPPKHWKKQTTVGCSDERGRARS